MGCVIERNRALLITREQQGNPGGQARCRDSDACREPFDVSPPALRLLKELQFAFVDTPCREHAEGFWARRYQVVGALVDILIVEDDKRTHAAMMKLVGRMGYVPRGACTYADAMQEVLRKAPQVLITDWDLGESKSGVDVAAQALAQRSNCKVVFCSGNNLASLRRRTRHLNICRYIRKPISLTRLRSEFERVLEQT